MKGPATLNSFTYSYVTVWSNQMGTDFADILDLVSLNKKSRDEEIISHFNPYDAGSCRIISTNVTMYTYCASCQIKIITIIVWTFCFSFIWFKRLPPSLDVMLTLSKTTSPQKPFRSDCIQLNKTWFLDLIKACDIHLQC